MFSENSSCLRALTPVQTKINLLHSLGRKLSINCHPGDRCCSCCRHGAMNLCNFPILGNQVLTFDTAPRQQGMSSVASVKPPGYRSRGSRRILVAWLVDSKGSGAGFSESCKLHSPCCLFYPPKRCCRVTCNLVQSPACGSRLASKSVRVLSSGSTKIVR